jgi:iron uptake system component EfeO
MKHIFLTALCTLGAASLAACADKTNDDYRADVVTSMHDSIAGDLEEMVAAARSLQAASPPHAWDQGADGAAILKMRDEWKRLRTAYEHVEGAIIALFPDIDKTMDGRYEELLARLGAAGDDNPFDDVGVTGMHGIERILYAPDIRNEVVQFESRLPGYAAAAYPATDADALSFKTVLVQLLIDDALTLRKRWQPAAIDIGQAYVGLVGLMDEQKDKINLAVTGEEESRYANITLFDLRQNLEGTQKVYDLFRDWIHSKSSGPNSDSVLRGKFEQLGGVYEASSSTDALPEAPVDWRRDQPTAANLATPFGTLWKHVHETVGNDPHSSGSVVYEMNQIATLLGLPAFDDSAASRRSAR